MITTSALPEPIAELVEQVQASRLPAPSERTRIREEAGVSLRAVARACGVTVGAVIKWESGETTPRPKHAAVYGELLRALSEAVR